MVPEQFDSHGELRRYETLLHLADVVVHHRGLDELFRELAEHLREFAAFELATFSLHDSSKNVMRVHLWEEPGLLPTIAELPVEGSAAGRAWQNQQPFVVPGQDVEKYLQVACGRAKEKGIRSYCALPLTTTQRRLGALGLGSLQEEAYGEKDLRMLQHVTDVVALAVENSLMFGALQLERQRLQMLLEVTNKLVTSHDLREIFPAIAGFIHNVVRQNYASVAIHDEPARSLHIYALDPSPAGASIVTESTISVQEPSTGRAFLEKEMHIYNHEQMVEMRSDFVERMLGQGFQSLCCIPLTTRRDTIGTLNLASTQNDAFLSQDLGFLQQVAAQLAVALDNAQVHREIASIKDKLAHEKSYLESEIRSERNFEEIVGDSPALRRVLSQVRTVAPSNATVLILGETGTGKELIAHAVHRLSSRKDASFIKLNCAAIPTGLLESELFGHERGAFTGAVTQKVGRLELADKGTLFLDEVGDIPLELQPKLLRVLQDQEFERLGSNRTIRVNVRLVAATNRNLAKSVAEREFRSDLYYRLNVFPIHMPPLREREKDIPLLVSYFVQKYARRMNKQIEIIPTETMQALSSWEWPGNVRELENFIERSVILSEAATLNVPLTELQPFDQQSSENDGTLEELERTLITRVLRETRGVIAGPRGAAARLGL
ncbi:MAG TPA: sigma 54-interacting transcriptional regulator, partial [Terriglobales bacterium]|nr:sigma 54-interacting transcriptional regulator [Terriglobales bacterium]